MGANKLSLGIYKVNNGTVGQKVVPLFSEKDWSDNYSKIGFSAAKATGFKGTAANLTGPAQVSFTFQANQVYTLGLFSQSWSTDTWTNYSTTKLNPYQFQKAVFGAAGSKNADGQAFAGVSSYSSSHIG